MAETKFKMIRVGPLAQIDASLVEKWRDRVPGFGPAFDLFRGRSRGEIVEYSQVEETAGLSRATKEYAKAIRCAKEAMRFITGITVRSKPRYGYVLSTIEDEMTTHVDKTLAASQRKIKNQALNVALVRQDGLSMHDRRMQVFAREQCDQAAGMIQTRREVIERALSAPETLPRLASE